MRILVRFTTCAGHDLEKYDRLPRRGIGRVAAGRA